MFHRWLIRLSLTSLGIAAVLAIAMVLLDESDFGWSAVWTAIFTGVACLLVMAISQKMADKPPRHAMSLAIGTVVVSYVLIILATWQVFQWIGQDVNGRAVVAAIHIFITGLVSAAFLRATVQPGMRYAGVAGLVVAAGVLVIWQTAIWVSNGEGYLPGQGLILLCYGLGIVALLAGLSPLRRHHWRWLGVIAAAIGVVAATRSLWRDDYDPDQLTVIASTFVAIFAYTNMILLAPLKREVRWVAWGAIPVFAGSAILIAIFILDINNGMQSNELLGRVAGASVIAVAAISLAVMVLARAHRIATPATKVHLADAPIPMTCPVCQTHQSVATGESMCVECGVRIHLRIEEPHCANCDYLLYRLERDQCPECGTAFHFQRGTRL